MTGLPLRSRALGLWFPPAALLLVGWLVVVAAGRALVGGIVMASAFALAGALRAWLPEARAGGLYVRSRRVDVALYVVTAAIVLLAFVAVDLRPRG